MGNAAERPLALDTANALEQPLIAAIAAGQALGRGTRISVNLLIYQPASKSYSPWRGMTWKVPLESVAQGGQLAEGVDLLVRALALSPTVTLNTLREIVGGD